MQIIEKPRTEEAVLSRVEPGAEAEELMEDLRDWADSCVNHLCGCSCSC